jgi:hypothetical protein
MPYLSTASISVWLDDVTDDIPAWIVAANQADSGEYEGDMLPLKVIPIAVDDDDEMTDCEDREQDAIACAKAVAAALGVQAIHSPRKGRPHVILN